MLKYLLVAAVVWLVWRLLAAPSRPKDAAARARAVLKVRADADAADIRAAHRRLMADAHPDRGGSDEAARRLNAARDTLLARLDERA